MGFNPDDIVTIELDCVGWHQPYTRDITRHQLGQLLLSLDDMAADTDDRAADHMQKWPSPDEAYANAPHVSAETTRLNATSANPETGPDREWYLRRAALLDRLALHTAGLDNAPAAHTAAEEAEETALILLALDQASPDYDPRAYVRQQYALWHAQQGSGPEPSRS
ncbi:hypothetical protein [Streptomyces kronopolitis]|uniref:hypothetical protein n=1 Tax=Streptomyces kronopolitis TaxID=1612435 RepID=UPI0020BFDA38|nr:hypothetical protein [Streptomyces kronopolitis]MCL6300490.1 hypothetical protein [Streptomyces kronopolitis]